jgi:hypothetical protein
MLLVEVGVLGEWLQPFDVLFVHIFGWVTQQGIQETWLVHQLLGWAPVVNDSLLSCIVHLPIGFLIEKHTHCGHDHHHIDVGLLHSLNLSDILLSDLL